MISPPLTNREVSFSGASDKIRFRILYIGDIHESYIAAARAKTAMDALEKEAKDSGRIVYRINVGDSHTGQSPRKWPLNIRITDALGADLKIFGNHETYLPTVPFVDALFKWAKKPYWFSNLRFPVVGEYLPALKQKLIRVKESFLSHLKARGLGIVALGAPTESDRLRKHTFPLGENQTVQKIVKMARQLKKRFLPVILVSHHGYDWDKAFAQTAKAGKIDVILGGHTHNPLDGLKEGETFFKTPEGKRVIVTNAGAFAEYVGCLDLDTEGGEVVHAENRLLDTSRFDPAPEIISLVQEYVPDTSVLANVMTEADSAKEKRKQLYFLADSARKLGQTPIGLVRENEYRRNLKGEVTPVELALTLPYQEPMVTVNLSGQDLLAAVEKSEQARQSKTWIGPSLIMAGVRWDPAAPGDLNKLQVEATPGAWEPLQAGKQYPVSMCRFIVDSEKNYAMLNKPDAVVRQFSEMMAEVMQVGMKNSVFEGTKPQAFPEAANRV